MSLLLDALKRAEEAKRLAAQPGTSPARDTAREAESLTLAPKDDDKSPLPDLDAHLESVEQDLRAEVTVSEKPAARVPPSSVQTPSSGAAQAAARNVFAAKPPAAPAKSKTMLIAGTAGGIAAIGIVGYFGYQYMQLSGMLTPPIPANPPLATPAAANAAGPLAGMAPPSVSAPAAAPPRPTETTPVTAAADARSGTTPDAARPEARPRIASPVARREPNAVRVSTAPKAIDSRLSAAYAALQSGQLAAAEAGYREVLAREPDNLDALLGTAVIAARAGRFEEAQAAYLEVLEAAPRNPAAHAGLLSLSGAMPAAQRESRLKQLLATPPSDPTLAGLLHFTLGNVYGEQQRWAEAQAAYFEATVADRDNPDYLYNLAISLEHLQKPTLAARQYEAAVRAARQRPFGFDLDAASARAAALTR